MEERERVQRQVIKGERARVVQEELLAFYQDEEKSIVNRITASKSAPEAWNFICELRALTRVMRKMLNEAGMGAAAAKKFLNTTEE